MAAACLIWRSRCIPSSATSGTLINVARMATASNGMSPRKISRVVSASASPIVLPALPRATHWLRCFSLHSRSHRLPVPAREGNAIMHRKHENLQRGVLGLDAAYALESTYTRLRHVHDDDVGTVGVAELVDGFAAVEFCHHFEARTALQQQFWDASRISACSSAWILRRDSCPVRAIATSIPATNMARVSSATRARKLTSGHAPQYP